MLVDLTSDTDEIIPPVALAPGGQGIEINRCLVSIAAQGNATVSPQSKGNGHMAIDRRRKHETLVIVRVLADDIHPPGRDGDGARRIAKRLAEAIAGAFIKLVWCAHGRSIRAKSQSSASVGLATTGRSGSVRRSRSRRQVWMPIAGRLLRKARAISDNVPRPPPTATTPSAVRARIALRA